MQTTKIVVYLCEHAPLQAHNSHEHRESNGSHAVPLEKGHQVSKPNEHHNLDAREVLIYIAEIFPFRKIFLGTKPKEKHHGNLKYKQGGRSRLKILVDTHVVPIMTGGDQEL